MSQDDIFRDWVKYLQAADLVTTTTEMLAGRISSFTKSPVKVLPNYVRREDVCDDYDPFEDLKEIRIIYSCSESHQGDFKFIVPVLKRLGEAYPQVKIISHGGLDFGYHYPWYKGKMKHLRKVSYNSYYKFLQEEKPHIFIAPLLATPHNVSRSDLKYLQAGALKAAFVGSNLEPYASLRKKKSSAILTDFKLGWWWQLRKLIRNPSLARDMGQKAFEDVRDNFVLEDHIGLWEDTFSDLVVDGCTRQN
jgi:glycosyltransferase involved in cell wall biosynthesis